MSRFQSANAFNYTAEIHSVCVDLCRRIPAFSHIDMERVAVSFAQTRHSEPHGVFACMMPMRFEGGSLITQQRKRSFTLQRCYKNDGTEYLYILYFYVPRFIELTLSRKLETIVHELYHIGPKFDGDLRRFPGRCFAHGSSKKKYDEQVRGFLNHWLKQDPPENLWGFLRADFRTLQAEYGRLRGTRIIPPKLIPCEK
ncbi:MAG: hypothetical protein ACRCUY_11905 [Thermoguttaceae bacterium]